MRGDFSRQTHAGIWTDAQVGDMISGANAIDDRGNAFCDPLDVQIAPGGHQRRNIVRNPSGIIIGKQAHISIVLISLVERRSSTHYQPPMLQ